MITFYDEFILGFYFVFIIAIGLIFRRQSKNTSDYFRAGGAMPWWITGTSAWIAGFSAWTFTGAAGKVYETGTLVLCLYYGNVVGLALIYLFTCTRFRRMRVVTWMEAVKERYGPGTAQLYTWLKVPLTLILSGVGMNAIGVFMSAVFHVNIVPVLIVLGIVVTLVSMVGGAWAVLASDFVQMFLVMTITIVAAVLTLRLPQVGGLTGLLHKVPASDFHWAQLERPDVLVLWAITLVWSGLLAGNNMEGATMYLMAKSDKDAKRMVLIPLIGSLIGPLIWFIPSMAASFLHPNLAAEFPLAKSPHETAFVAVCLQVLPQGLIGLLLCAMLGATLTSMDAGLNKGAGVFVRSFYLPVLDPNCTEKRLLVVSKLCTLLFGLIIVSVAVVVSRYRTMGLFDLSNQLAASLGTPLALPLLWGLFYKKTPAWSAWSTVLVGFLMAWYANHFLTAAQVQGLIGGHAALSPREQTDTMLVATTALVVFVGSAWYFFTSLFYDRSPASHKERVERFFLNLRTPVDAHGEGQQDYDHTIYRLIGGLCLVYGVFILALTAIPNSATGRLCFVFCGGAVLIAGAVLTVLSRKTRRPVPDFIEEVTTGEPLEDETKSVSSSV